MNTTILSPRYNINTGHMNAYEFLHQFMDFDTVSVVNFLEPTDVRYISDVSYQ